MPVKVQGNPDKKLPAAGNVDRLILKNWKGSGPVVQISPGVTDHTIADAGVWADGAAVIEGEAKLIWASFAHVIVLDGKQPVEGAEVVISDSKAKTGKDGKAILGPFPVMEVTRQSAKTVAREYQVQVAHLGKKASSSFKPDGTPINLKLILKK
jgi:hypothetical protein